MTASDDGDEHEPFSLHTSALASFARIRVSGVLEETTCELLDQAVVDAISRGTATLIIDLTDLTEIDARGIEHLLGLRITCVLQRVTVQFTRPASNLAEALDDPRIRPPLSFAD